MGENGEHGQGMKTVTRLPASSPAVVERKMDEAFAIVAEAIDEHITKAGKRLAGECVLYSGGNDSTVLTHLFRDAADFAVHINTGIGIEETRQFVRDTTSAWELPLIEEHGNSYRELVIRYGFPGPGQHFRMYNNLKERGLRKVRRRLVEHSRRERVLFIAGMRRDESSRRAKNVERHHREGSTVWCSPLIDWTDADMATYREMHPDLPRNPVSAHLHMSGECLCGSFAKVGELDEIGFFYPEAAVYIRGLESEVLAAGNVPEQKCQWGWGAYRTLDDRPRVVVYEWCATCGQDALTDIDEHVENHGTIDHPWNPVREERTVAGPTKADVVKLGPLCHQCVMFEEVPT